MAGAFLGVSDAAHPKESSFTNHFITTKNHQKTPLFTTERQGAVPKITC